MGQNYQRSASMTAQSFRFLDLLPELRVMVYERINIMIRHHILKKPISPGESKHTSRSRLVVCICILATCRQINYEAQQIFAEKFDSIRSQPVRFYVDVASALDLVSRKSPLIACFGIKTPKIVNGRYTLTKAREHERTLSMQQGMSLKDMAEGCNITEFVNRSRGAVAQAKKTPLTVAQPYHVEIILSQDVTAWDPRIFRAFLHNLNRLATRTRMSVPVKSKVPKTDAQSEALLVKDWKFWQLIYNDDIAMPLRSKVWLEDLGENGEVTI